MELEEAIKLVGWAVSNFPTMQERDMRPTAQLWYNMLSDIPYEIAEKALMKVLTTAKYFPTVAEIREAIVEIVEPKTMSAAEAWGEVEKKIRWYGYYRGAEALENMSPQVAKVVRYIGWREICLSEEPAVIRAQFMKMYQQVAEREQKERLLPQGLRDDIKRIADARTLNQLEEGMEDEEEGRSY